ncbi:hypothetical protein [Rosenbergiella australiborealis]|uniref:hypothetical protein n=1 Tax=Rosenbergiella australiborealis TaxID=1544696 RepID=UPI001F4D443B|nr:hypothetical protein [Rosenbergiella australiborealis]
MKKIALLVSALTLSFGALAATQASEEALATAHKKADTAKEKLHAEQNIGAQQKLKAKHAAEGQANSTSSKISEGSQKAWHSTKQGVEKGWDKTKEGAEDLKDDISP